MPAGSFNISRLIRELGHKNQIEMPVSKNIQATLPVASMAGQVPVHVAGSAMAGGWHGAVVGEYLNFELQSLDPGGLVVWFVHRNQATNVDLGWILSDGPATWLTGPLDCVALDFTNEPTISRLRVGTVGTSGSGTRPRFRAGTYLFDGFAPLHVPRGKALNMRSVTTNVSAYLTVAWCGIAATESEE